MSGSECINYKVKDIRSRGRRKQTWREIVEERLSDLTTEQRGCYRLR